VTIYEVRRGKHIAISKADAAEALAYAKACSHFPGQLQVYAVERREWLITEPPSVVPIGAAGLKAGRGRA
jgi:hypothetical protein